jgi:hypothetical protein
MKKKTKFRRVRSRSSGGKPWSTKEENLLLKLVREGKEWSDIAAALNRTYSGVQMRFQTLRHSDLRALDVVPKKITRAERPELVADFTCGSVSKPGRRVINLVKGAIGLEASDPSAPLLEWDLVLGAIIRELLLLRLRADMGWLRITVSQISSAKLGVGREGLRRMLTGLENSGMIERFVGYPVTIAFSNRSARKGRLVLLRASPRLLDLCEQNGISAANLSTHFYSLKQ